MGFAHRGVDGPQHRRVRGSVRGGGDERGGWSAAHRAARAGDAGGGGARRGVLGPADAGTSAVVAGRGGSGRERCGSAVGSWTRREFEEGGEGRGARAKCGGVEHVARKAAWWR